MEPRIIFLFFKNASGRSDNEKMQIRKAMKKENEEKSKNDVAKNEKIELAKEESENK